MPKITDGASWNPTYLNNLDNLESGGRAKLASWVNSIFVIDYVKSVYLIK